MAIPNEMLKKALLLPPIESGTHRSTAAEPRPAGQELNVLWAKEAESRLDAYDAGKLKAVSLDKVLSKYKKG